MFQTSIATWLKQPKQVKESPAEVLKDDGLKGCEPTTNSDDIAVTSPSLGMKTPPTQPTPPARSKESQPSRSLPTNVSIVRCTDEHMKSFQRLNALLLPIPYQPAFYRETLEDPVIASLSRVALWKDSPRQAKDSKQAQADKTNSADETNGQLVAAIRCRLLKPPLDVPGQPPSLYISTISTLAPFRGHGIASHLLATVTRTAVDDYGATSVTAHVWEANQEAMAWYEKRGFKVITKQEDYYRRLAPRTAAFVVRKEIGPSEMM